MEPIVTGVTGSQEEVRAVVTLVAQVEHAQRNGLPDAFTELFRQDAFWTMPYGDPRPALRRSAPSPTALCPARPVSRRPSPTKPSPSCSSGPTSP